MALAKRYSDSFVAVDGTIWKTEIFQEGFTGTVGGLEYSINPLVIEWSETGKMEPVQCSNATLTLISTSDREFIDLYTVAVGSVRLDVYRNNSLYWSGCIDTELYEEPYSTDKGYEVTLTFSDFGALDRFEWSQTGFMTVHDMITECLSLSGVSYGSIVKYISTKGTRFDTAALTLQDLNVNQENFYDEEREPMSARDVLAGVLQPLALRLIQKNGNIYVYDLNALHALTAGAITWDGTDSVLGVDKTYNNVRVTFSPYAQAAIMEGKVEPDESLTADTGGTLVRRSYKRESSQLTDMDGFRFHFNSTLKSNLTLSNGAKFFQIRAIYSGSDETGVVESFKKGDYPILIEGTTNPQVTQQVIAPKDCGTQAGEDVDTEAIITCPRVFIGVRTNSASSSRLRITVPMLADARYNPFEQNSDDNDDEFYLTGTIIRNWAPGPYSYLNAACNWVYVPIKLELQNEDGDVLYHFQNKAVMNSSGYDHSAPGFAWTSGAAEWGDAYLCYYGDDRVDGSGILGWQKNKPIIGRYADELPDVWKTIEDGEYIPMPPQGGYLVLTIGSGLHTADHAFVLTDTYRRMRWILFKEPTITLCKSNYKEQETEDIEDSAWINTAAKEELEISTIMGTGKEAYGIPNAKGQFYNSTLGSIFTTFYRAGVTDRLERLLIGTAYSQYATRRAVLSGTAQIIPAFGVLSDAATSGKFILLSELQNCREATSEIVAAEFGEDNYQATTDE